MVSVIAMGTFDCGIEPQSDSTKDYNIDVCCFSSKHAILRRKGKYWLARNEVNVFEWSDMSTRELLFSVSWHYKDPLSFLV
jgi:hypothetical protein